jgi:nucleotide-binding universal stress UspA family protein
MYGRSDQDNLNEFIINRRDLMRVLIAIDRSEASLEAVRRVSAEEWPQGSEFNLLTVIHDGATEASAGFVTSTRHQLTNLGDELAKRVHGSIVGTDCEVGDAADVILNRAERWHADLVVVGSHSKTKIESCFLGSV